MGYTHYWSFVKVKGKTAESVEQAYQKAIKECQKVCHVYNREVTELGETWNRLSGYTAHSKIGFYGGLEINGKGDNGHEDFTMREHFNQNFEQGFKPGSNFCKTAMKPYDTVVTACLAILKYRLGDSITVSSDGDASDWIAGAQLASRVIKRKVMNPLGQVKKKVLTLVR